MNAPLWSDAGGHIGTAPTNLHHIFPRIPHKQNNHLHTILPNDINRFMRNLPKRNQPPMRNPQNGINRPRVICPNETVGAAPVCPPERPRSGVSIPKIHALYAGNERWMRPCGATRAGSGVSIPKIHVLCAGIERWMRPYRATRAGTQAPPLPIPRNIFHAILHKQNNHLRAIHPNETRKQSTHTSGAEMHRALPPPFLK